MKKNKVKTSKGKDFFILFILSALFSIIMFYIYFSKEEIIICKVKGVYTNYEVKEKSRKSKKRIKIGVDNNNLFIKTIILSSFKEKIFLEKVKIGDTVNIELENNSIVQISKNSEPFINKYEREELERNDNLSGLALGIVFTFFSVVLFFKYRRVMYQN